jgi:hypothetical protein
VSNLVKKCQIKKLLTIKRIDDRSLFIVNITWRKTMVGGFISRVNKITPDGKYIGYFSDKSILPFKKGDIVVIKKGTKYHSTRDGQYHIAGKTYKVKVDHLITGAEYMDRGKMIVKNPVVTWVGSGGYWHRADVNDVEKA